MVKPFVPGEVLLSMWTALLNQTSGLQGCCDVSCGILAGNDPGTGSGWQQSRPNRTPLCSDEIVSPNAAAAPLASSHEVSLHLFHFHFHSFPAAAARPCTTADVLARGGKAILPGREGFQSMKAQQAQTVGRGPRRAGRPGFCATKARPQCFGSGTGVGRLCVHELTSLGRCPHSCCLECRGTLTLELECLVLPVTCSAWQFHLGMLLPTDRHCLPGHFFDTAKLLGPRNGGLRGGRVSSTC